MSTTQSIFRMDERRPDLMVDRNRANLLLYDKGKWIGGRVISKTSNWVEGEEYLQANSTSTSNMVIETNLVYKGSPLLTVAERIIYVNDSASTHTARIQLGYMNDSDVFTLVAAESVSSVTVKKSVAYEGIEADGYYVNQRTVNLTNQTAAKGRKVCLRLTTYFGVWRIDKVWLSGVQRL